MALLATENRDHSRYVTDTDGRLVIVQSEGQSQADTATVTTVNDTNVSTQLLALNDNRLGATFYNTSTADLYLKFGTTASTTSFTVKIPPDGYYELPIPVYTGRIDGIWSADATGLVAITELSG